MRSLGWTVFLVTGAVNLQLPLYGVLPGELFRMGYASWSGVIWAPV